MNTAAALYMLIYTTIKDREDSEIERSARKQMGEGAFKRLMRTITIALPRAAGHTSTAESLIALCQSDKAILYIDPNAVPYKKQNPSYGVYAVDPNCLSREESLLQLCRGQRFRFVIVDGMRAGDRRREAILKACEQLEWDWLVVLG